MKKHSWERIQPGYYISDDRTFEIIRPGVSGAWMLYKRISARFVLLATCRSLRRAKAIAGGEVHNAENNSGRADNGPV